MTSRFAALAASILSLTAASGAFAQDVEYALLNSSSLALTEFYTSSTDDEEWGEDLLAATDLLPGEAGSVVIADGGESCEYDMLFIFEDGTELTDTVDICQIASYELFD
ncbi:hypothetical protein [Roseicyclus marinus]|uniref:hypothetical protein n=1 Tax=Roseicyclus marinus TaxID=2161673 RepID=UPI00240FDE69|nr:hypothetical protein [Roseicyclus marinus]MDG3041067.1 hypothetical protein [Roseicyclus marinus]